MSFILDALKKSEHDRQRQTVPGLVESGFVRPRPRLPRWAIAVFALLAVNLVVLAFVLTRSFMGPSATRADAPVTSGEHAAQVPASSDGGKPFSPLDAPAPAPAAAAASAQYAPEIPVPAADGAMSSGLAPLKEAPVSRAPPSYPGTMRLSRRRDPLLTENADAPGEDEEILPTINEINLKGAQALPELHLDVHVFATKADERFVFINMRKYHEGATLEEGPTLERIRRDGVILNYNGLRFLLPRQ